MKLNTLFFIFSLFAATVSAQKYTNTETQTIVKEWNGLAISSEKSIHQNIKDADMFSKATSLFKTGVIEEDAMLTAFVMTNSSFDALDEEKQKLVFERTWKSHVLFHLIPGRVDSASLEKAIANGNGTAYFDTVLGQQLGVKKVNDTIVLFDAQGNTANIIAQDYFHKNGFLHIIEGYLQPSTEQ